MDAHLHDDTVTDLEPKRLFLWTLSWVSMHMRLYSGLQVVCTELVPSGQFFG